MSSMRALRISLVVIGIFQLVLGALFLLVPGQAADLLGLRPAAPPWVNWLFAMMAAPFLGYAYGMFTPARAPRARGPWINTMIVTQAIDWAATIASLIAGDLTLHQVTTPPFVPG